MGRIQTNIGLITGMPIGETVDKLMELAGKPRDMLVDRTDQFREEQFAVTELSAMLLAVRYITESLGKKELYEKRQATSSDPDTLTATVTGDPPKGSYQFTPLRMVQCQQLLSSGFKTDTEPIGGGRLTFRFGDHVQRCAPLELFGDGEGVVRGKISITDRSGARAHVDLSTVQTVDDVLEAINGNNAINVTAVARGDRIRLIDNTGQAVSNLQVREVAGGSTAASLGLAGIDVAGSVADGQEMLRLYEDLELDVLNDGSGVYTSSVLDEISYELRDGTSGTIDFSPIQSGGSEVDRETTLGDILEVINSTEPDKLKAEIAPDGDRLIVTDMTTEGDGTFTLSSLYDFETLADLGLDGESVDGVITGRRIMAGAKTVLLSSLGGGKGLGQLGTLELSDRSGASDTVDLSPAETLEEVIDIINAADVGIVARVNEARNGIELIDTTGEEAGYLIVANADDTATADKLGIAVDDDVTATGSGDLHLQIIAHNTRLDELNGGAGVDRGRIRIIDSTNSFADLDLRDKDIQTVGDVIREINRLSARVVAEINPTGDGIRLRDLAHGPGSLQVHQEANTTAARDLHLFRTAKELDIDGQTTQVIDGSTTYSIELDDGTSEITHDTRLHELNWGLGVAPGSFTIVDTRGFRAEFRLQAEGIQTIGQLIQAINGLPVAVRAELNDTRDGIRLTDLAHGMQKLRVLEGDSSTAKDLHLLREPTEITVLNRKTKVIDGKGSYTTVRSLDDLRQKINSLNAGVSAMTFVDGSSRPFRLSLISDRAGRTGQLIVDTSEVNLSINETVRARDALLVFGEAEMAASSVLVSSASNTFRGVLPGMTLEIKQTSDNPVTVSLGTTDVDLVANVQAMVENYNRFRERLNELTFYDVQTDTRSTLSGDAAALRLDSELSYFLSGRFVAAGPIQSLAEIGISIKHGGMLTFDDSKLKARFAADPEAVREFFTKEQFGVSAKFNNLIEQISGQDVSLLAHRFKTLTDKIARNEQRIEFLNERLENQRNRLFLEFYRMEIAIGKMYANLSALDAIQPLTPIVSVRRTGE